MNNNNNNLIVEPFGTFDTTKVKSNPFVKQPVRGKTTNVGLNLDENVLKYFQNVAAKHNWTVDFAINNYLKRAMV